jgi:hypothetical protein
VERFCRRRRGRMKAFWKCQTNDEIKELMGNPRSVRILQRTDSGFAAQKRILMGMTPEVLGLIVSWAVTEDRAGRLIGDKWDHVSVSLRDRPPTWAEMEVVRNAIWEPDETVLQYHPSHNQARINPYCLHLWRPQEGPLLLPNYEAYGLVPSEEAK